MMCAPCAVKDRAAVISCKVQGLGRGCEKKEKPKAKGVFFFFCRETEFLNYEFGFV
jgi:hypothetical protein